MRQRLGILTLGMLIAALGVATVAAPVIADGGRPFVTALTGAAERPGPGDPDGTGTAWITLNQGLSEVCWTLQASNITLPAAAAHIHIAPVDEPGPVVVPLSPPDASGNSSGCTTASQELIKAIRQNPEAYYVNVHTSDFPAGAIRGQLHK